MPLYEYECPKDGVFELMRKFSDPPVEACPKCGGPIEKLASAPAIQFKGTGWYVTDYARKGGGDSGSKSESKAESESKSKAESKSESKSESKDTSSSKSTDSGSSSSTGSSGGSSGDKK